MLFEYPAKAAYGKILPKNKIYEHASPSRSVRDLFVEQVDQIIWKFKLAPETINVPATNAVPEIQIFSITLKGDSLKEDILRCIDGAIPFPILFELTHGARCKMVAAYKRPSEADSRKWVVGNYFASEWLPADTQRVRLPVALDLASLYSALLSSLLPHAALPGEGMSARIGRIELIRQRQREVDKLTSQLEREKQFNRKVEINANIRNLKSEIAALSSAGQVA